MIRVGIAYLVVAWLLAQVADLGLDAFEAPAWVMQTFLLLLVLGFPVVLVLAWAFELTPEGIRPEAEVDRGVAMGPKSIAVLPFDNLSDSQENAFFASGVHEDILTYLAKVADLRVISRTSVRQFSGDARAGTRRSASPGRCSNRTRWPATGSQHRASARARRGF